MSEGKRVTIDGRYGEGGGQILRSALTLSALSGLPVYIDHIRSNRKRPGLRPQHLIAVNALAEITGAAVSGAGIDSTELLFEPKGVRGGHYRFHIGTAGSTGLVLQAMIPALLFGNAPSYIQITGGTHVPWSPSFHYLYNVFLPALQRMGGDVNLEILRWGWHPKGGGKVEASVQPAQGLRAITILHRGNLLGLHVLSAVSNLPLHIAERQRDQALTRLRRFRPASQTSIEQAPSPGQGTILFVAAQFEGSTAGFSSLGKRGKRAEAVADDACRDFTAFLDSPGAIDLHLADQLVLYMALARGRSSFVTERITDHLLTNIWVIERFLPVSFDIERNTGWVEVEGIGLEPA
jgi:RNA 3'-terminal phosphate cyclase (ATP)